jgi:hypothetical protein
MEATLKLPEAIASRLEHLAEEEGISIDGLLRLLVSEHLERHGRVRPGNRPRRDITLPLIPAEQMGTVSPVSGADLDDLLALDDLAS